MTTEVTLEVRDGFIIGIFNYCDRWCEACAFTSRCRVFADAAEAEAALDPNLNAVVEAPPLPQDLPPPPPKWVEELFQDINDAAGPPISDEDYENLRPTLQPEYRAIEARAHDYCNQVHAWLCAREFFSISDPGDPRAVIAWFHTLIPAKIHRALHGLAEGGLEDRDWPPDHDGSAKVALLGIDSSHAAWLDLVQCGLAPASDSAPFNADLVWLSEALERVFPNARAFVRPALDEPDEVAKLVAQEGER